MLPDTWHLTEDIEDFLAREAVGDAGAEAAAPPAAGGAL